MVVVDESRLFALNSLQTKEMMRNLIAWQTADLIKVNAEREDGSIGRVKYKTRQREKDR